MDLFDTIFVPDHVLGMVSQGPGKSIMMEAARAYDAAPEFFNYLVVTGRIGAGLADGEGPVSDREYHQNEGRRMQTMDALALIKCAHMDDTELQELIDQRKGE